MALTDGLLVQVFPTEGDVGIKDIVSDTLFTGTGTPTLIIDEGAPAWSIPSGTLLTKLLTERTVSGAVAGDGVTVAMRFKLTANGTNSFLSLGGFKGSADTVDQNIRITRNGTSNYRGRVNATLSPTLTGLTNSTVITLVFRVSFRDGTLDTGDIWRNLVGRVGTDPDSVSAGANFGSITFDRAFLNCQTDAAYTLYDFAVWGRELTNTEGANVADDYRSVMPSPGAVVTPISFSGTIPVQSFESSEEVSVNLSGYFSGTETPFTFANTGTDLSGSGLSINSAGLLSGTYTGTEVSGVIVTGTDTATNTASSNAFNITTTVAGVSNISIASSLPTLTSAMSMTFTPSSVGTITISDWANNAGTPLPNITDITVNVRSLVDGSLVYRTTSASTTSGSDCIVSDISIVPDTEYEVTALKFNGTSYDIGIAITTAT